MGTHILKKLPGCWLLTAVWMRQYRISGTDGPAVSHLTHAHAQEQAAGTSWCKIQCKTLLMLRNAGTPSKQSQRSPGGYLVFEEKGREGPTISGPPGKPWAKVQGPVIHQRASGPQECPGLLSVPLFPNQPRLLNTAAVNSGKLTFLGANSFL